MPEDHEYTEDGLPYFVDDEGVRRVLGCRESTAEELSLLQAGAIDDIPSARWKVVTHEECQARVEEFLKAYLLNQQSHGSCVGFSGAGALMWDLWSIGYPLPDRLSGAYIYSWINGNRDRGASITSALTELSTHGTCFEKTVPWNVIYRRDIPAEADAEAQRFMLETGMRISGFETVVTAGQVGKPVQFGINAGRAMNKFDSEGIAGYVGPGSNHSVFCAPLLVKCVSRAGFKVPMINSWGKWGPWKTGWCYVVDKHINGGGGGFIHGTPKYDPNSPLPPRVVA